MDSYALQAKRRVINALRSFFTDRDFFELETPMLVPSPGMEVHLHGFQTQYETWNGQSIPYFLPTSPVFAIKKALGQGFEKVFEIARVFRNQGELGAQHHPEFNMLEWYRPGDYTHIMDDVAQLFSYLKAHLDDIPTTTYGWDQMTRRSVAQCFHDLAGLDLERGLDDLATWRNQATQVLDEQIPADDHFQDIFFRVWMKRIEPQLGLHGPEIVYDYPAEMAALARLKSTDPRWAERFEVYVRGVELGNAFSELTDSEEQARRFASANGDREALGYLPHPVDDDLISAVGRMKPTGGIAIGVERLVMVLYDIPDIRQLFLQPVTDAKRM